MTLPCDTSSNNQTSLILRKEERCTFPHLISLLIRRKYYSNRCGLKSGNEYRFMKYVFFEESVSVAPTPNVCRSYLKIADF